MTPKPIGPDGRDCKCHIQMWQLVDGNGLLQGGKANRPLGFGGPPRYQNQQPPCQGPGG